MSFDNLHIAISGQGARWEIPYRRRWYPDDYADHLRWQQFWRDLYAPFFPPITPGGTC